MSDYFVQQFRGGFALVWPRDPSLPLKAPGNRGRRTLVARDRAGAEAEARAIWQAADSGPRTVGRIMEGYLESIAHKPSHQRRKDAWKAMKTFWERTDPDLIDKTMCKSYALQRNAGPATIRYELLQISTALKWGRGEKLITAHPEMWLPETPERKVRHLDHDEFERFFAEVKMHHARLYVLLGLYTMARPAAILDLTWDRVDFNRRQIDLNPSGRKQTAKRRPIVAMNEELYTALKEAYEGRQSQYVIEKSGKKVDSIKKAFAAASARSGLKVTPYTLRHTGAVWAAEGGISMAALAQFMGHEDSTTTEKHYARFSPGYLANVANAIQRKGRSARGGSK